MISPERRAELMLAGHDAFNRREFFEAHEFWEEVWNVIDDPERTWVQGMIQIATGLHKLQEGRSDIAQKLLAKALVKLEGSRDALDGFDLGRFKREAHAIFGRLAKGERCEPAMKVHRLSAG